jgi:N-acetylglucosamine-6-phosphate deacetylase
MPQLHHRDPSIIGLLGASPYTSGGLREPGNKRVLTRTTPMALTAPTPPASPASPIYTASSHVSLRYITEPQSEAFDDHETPPQTPVLAATRVAGKVPRHGLHLEKGQVADLDFERPFYELIVDGIHSHPNSVRVSLPSFGCCYGS